MTKFSDLVRGFPESWHTQQKYWRCDQVLTEALEEAGYHIRTLSLGATSSGKQKSWSAWCRDRAETTQHPTTQSFNCVPSLCARHTLPPLLRNLSQVAWNVLCISAQTLQSLINTALAHARPSAGKCFSSLDSTYKNSTSPPKHSSKDAFLFIYPKIFAECLLIWTRPSSGDTKRRKECRV